MTNILDIPDEIQHKLWAKLLFGKIADKLLFLTDHNGNFYWDQVEEKNLKYLAKQCVGHPWANHFALAVLCITDRRLTPSSIMNITSVLNARFRDLFTHFNISKVEDLLPHHVEMYLTGQILPEHSDRQRQSLLTTYNTFIFNLKKWIGTQFTDDLQADLALYLLPNLPFDNRDFSARTKAITNAKNKRKEDTSAITPLLPEIRAIGHLRWNQVNRLREAFRKAIQSVKDNGLTLPIDFYYDESEYANERWYFKLWDFSSYEKSIDGEHFYRYNLEKQYFMEYIKAEKLDDGSDGDGPWFIDLLRLRVLGQWNSEYTTDEHRAKVIEYLNHWGYEMETDGKTIAPFLPRNPGLLMQGLYLTKKQRTTNKVFVSIEPIFAACMFARFALDIITSSGARINELLQISYDKECCVITVDKSASPPRKNYIFRLTPKGREEPENYYMPEDVFKFMTEIVKMLKESYGNDGIPEVEYDVESRKHLLNARKYIFQYNSRHINVFSINAILRFLLHGIIIQTAEGNQVIVKSHLLRHAFATHAVQNEKIPLDIVKSLLHQKDVEVTAYYSAPTSQQVSDSINSLHENWVTQIDIQKGILRGPEELQEIYDDYREKVGTLSKVVGGICTIDSVCPSKMACIGCAAKVPRPEFKDEITALYDWADESEKRFEKLGLPLEAQKMKITKNRARNELKEIQLIERYQKDEKHAPEIRIARK
ncbi:site-specific integrase [Paenibacillus methanolicus]|uniref:Phage integrase family protein n=1 Tax=Paenibacillus methanolicus TaxID=582686 RepID=A0A5S5CI03_9BACL|nr:site-specific integrase [Paenibacillus methanolicus]TYP79426.1 phage integrase family protein [Paenibacillus methanolicus]